MYEPASVVVHHESKSEGRFAHAQHNIQHFLSRWTGRVIDDHATWDADQRWSYQPTRESFISDETDGSFGARANAAMAYGSAMWTVVPMMNTSSTESASAWTRISDSMGPAAIHVAGTPQGPSALIIPAAVIPVVGGFDLQLPTDLDQLYDWLNRARLAGIMVVDHTQGGLPTAQPWYMQSGSAASIGRMARMWSSTSTEPRTAPTPMPFQLACAKDVHPDVELRKQVILVAPGFEDVDGLEAALRPLLTTLHADDNVSVLVRLLTGDAACATRLDQIADSFGDSADFPDVVVIEGQRCDDMSVAAAASTIMMAGVDQRIHASYAAHFGIRIWRPEDVTRDITQPLAA